MELIDKFVFWGRGYNDPQYLIIHETANPGATALNHVSYWSSGNQGGEAHYVTDWTEKVYHTTPDNYACWHVGGSANSWSVGIELCHATNQSDFEKVWKTGVEFAAWYLDLQGWDIERMKSHHEANQIWPTYSDHTDPDGYFTEFGKSWEQFVYEVQEMRGDCMRPADVWEYSYKDTAPGGNMYNCLCKMYETLEAMEKLQGKMEAELGKITELTKPVITSNPASKTVKIGEKAQFGVVVYGVGVSYQWQYLGSDKKTWYNVTASDYTGLKSKTMTVPVTAKRNGLAFRCKVTNAAGTVYSSSAKLTAVK